MRHLISVLIALTVLAAGQTALSGRRPAMSYEEQISPTGVEVRQDPLEVRRVRGEARDKLEMGIAAVRLGLFTDTPDHRLVATAVTGEKGNFDFGKMIPDGRYRLVAEYPGLCTANIPIVVGPGGSGRNIDLYMRYPGLDVCSYARLR